VSPRIGIPSCPLLNILKEFIDERKRERSGGGETVMGYILSIEVCKTILHRSQFIGRLYMSNDKKIIN
jgi:hypothetical protein